MDAIAEVLETVDLNDPPKMVHRSTQDCYMGYKCEIFNCWADNPSIGNSTGNTYNPWVCGNFTR